MKQGQYQGYEHIQAQGKPMYYPFNYPVHPSYLPMNNLHLLHNVAQLELPFAPPTAGQYQPHNAHPQEYRNARQPMYPGQPVGRSGGVLKDREMSCPVAGCSFRCDAQDVQTALNHFSAVHPNYPQLSMDFLQKHRLNYYAQNLSAHSGGAHKEDLTQSRPLEDNVSALNRNETAVPETVARSGYESPASDYEPSNDEDYMPSEKKGRRKSKPRRNATSRRSEDREDVSLVETIVESKTQTEEPQMVCCPIKGCKYKSKVDMNVRIHFTKVHKGLSFPEEFIKKYDLVVCPVPGCNSSASGVGKFHTLKTHIALHHPQLDINHYIKLAQASCSSSTKKEEVTAKTQTVNQQVKSNHSTLNLISKVPDRFGSNINSNFSNFIVKRNDEELDESTEASSRNSSNNSSANISPITVPALIDDDNGEQTKLPNAFYWPKENTDPAAHNMVLKPIKPNDAHVVVLEQTSGLRNTNAILKCPYPSCNHIRTGKKGWYNLRDHWLTVHTDAPLDPFLMKDTEKVAMYSQSEVKVVIPKKKRKTAFLLADNYDQNVETNEECRNDMSDMKRSKIARKSISLDSEVDVQ